MIPVWSNARRRTALLLFFGLSALYGLTVDANPSLDVVSANFASWHLVETGSPWIESLDFLGSHPLRHVWVASVGGHEVITRFPGVIAASMPAYWLLGLETFSNTPAAMTAAVMTAAAVSMIFLALSRSLAVRTSLIFCLGLGLGTPVWSVSADGMWPHTISVFAISGIAWSAAGRRWWLVGVFGGVALWGRVHVALVIAIVGLLEGWKARDWRLTAKVAVASSAFLVASLVWIRWMYQEWSLTAGNYAVPSFERRAGGDIPLWLNELGLILSPDRGVIPWTPVLILLLPSVIRSWRDLPSWSRSLLLGGCAYTLAQGYANHYSGGDSFWGYRLGIELVACALPAFAFSWGQVGRRARLVLGPVVAWQVLTIALGACLDLGGMPKEDAWRMNSVAFVVWQKPMVGVGLIAASVMLGVAVARILGASSARPSERSDAI